MLRDSLFYFVDKILPRKVAVIPYLSALKDFQLNSLNRWIDVSIWCRNSIYRGNYVFGLSDLDLTIYFEKDFHHQTLQEILRYQKHLKKVYPFLGELNLYVDSFSRELKGAVNYFEFHRDPILVKRIGQLESLDLKTDGAVFLLRMLYADRKKLRASPYLRQKKWGAHLGDITGEKHVRMINLSSVIDEIVKSIDEGLREEVRECLMTFNHDFQDGEVFDLKFHKLWKFLLPHKHIWFRERDEDLAEIENYKNSKIAQICLRQIDWEVWGLMTQYPFLPDNKYGFNIHLERLAEVANLLDEGGPTFKRVRFLLGNVAHYFPRD